MVVAFAPTRYVKLPLFVPRSKVVTSIQSFVLMTCQVQPPAVATLTVPNSEDSLCSRPFALNVTSQFVPHCVTV